MRKIKRIYKSILDNDIIASFFALIIYLYLNFVYFTSKKIIHYSDNFNQNLYQKKNAIYVFWHNRLALMFFLKPKNIKVSVVISMHRDGKIIASSGKLFGINIIKGSSSQNSIAAMRNIENELRKGNSIVITPDGPRGPVYCINSNVAKIASKIPLEIIPASYYSNKVKRFNSWDNFILPLPFSKIYFSIGKPVVMPKIVSDVNINCVNDFLKSELDRVTKHSEQLVRSEGVSDSI